MTQVALDSSAVAAWILRERGWTAVDAIFARAGDVVLPGPVLTEVIDVARRRGNTSTARRLADAVLAQGARVEPVHDDDLIRAAELAELSGNHPGDVTPGTGRPATLSLGDTLVLAVVERLGCPVVTRDRDWTRLHTEGVLGVTVVGL